MLAVLAVAVGLTGCGRATSGGGPSPFTPSDVPPSPSEENRARATALLDSMQRTAFDSAFVRLQDLAFTRTVRTERLRPGTAPASPGAPADPAQVEAFREREIAYRPAANPATDGTPLEGQVMRADSSGSFDASVLGRFAPASDPTSVPTNLATQAFPDDPAYLSEKKREAFQYTVRSSTYDGVPVHVVTVTARAKDTGTEPSARYARLTLHRDTYQLLAAHTVYTDRTLLYGQDTVFAISLRRGPGDAWVPHETHFRALLKMILRDPFDIRTTSTYRSFATPNTAA